MTDEPAADPAPEPDLSPDHAHADSRERARIEPAPASRSADLLPGLYLLGFVALAGAIYFLWANPPDSRLAPQEASRVETLQTQLAALRDDVAALKARAPGPSAADLARVQQQVADVASRPIPAPVSLQPVEARLNTLETRPTATPEQVQQLSGQVIALARQTPDLQPVKDRLDQLEKRPTIDPAALDKRFGEAEAQGKQLGGQTQQLATRLDDVSSKLAQTQADTAKKLAQEQDDVAKQFAQTQKDLANLGGRIDAAEALGKQTVEQVRSIGEKAQLSVRLQGAAAALAAGSKLGDIPGAPPALARFAAEAPPTEASLRGSFDTYAADAQKASQPAVTDSENFASRMWTRAQQTVTVRQGDRVLVGDPISGVLAHARDLLDIGDLAGSVAALDGLAGPAAKSMQPWVEKARALLDARAAIAHMAAG